jgi:large subunit ribosomal protein L13
MSTKTLKTEYTIDASGKRMGKVATEAAALLLGKNSPSFVRHIPEDVTVKITHASKMDISERKRMQEEYQTYSGYPGGQTREKLGALAKRRGYSEVLKRTISGMLPKNKLRTIRVKNLIITE